MCKKERAPVLEPVSYTHLDVYKRQILEVEKQPFVQGARALGLPEWMVYCRYIFPHVGLMLLPMMGVTMGAMLGGSAVIETVFSIKGIGYMMVQGITARDYVLMLSLIHIYKPSKNRTTIKKWSIEGA